MNRELTTQTAEAAYPAQSVALPKIRMRRRTYLWPLFGFLLFAVGPAAVSAYYYYAVAADRYVSEFRFAVRAGAAASAGGAGDTVGRSMGQASALLAFGDSFILEDFLTSAEALRQVEAALPLRAILDRDGGDPVRRYDPDMPPEDLLDYWRAAVDIGFDVATGITTVTVKTFRPEDSQAIADRLQRVMQQLIRDLSTPASAEFLAHAQRELEEAEGLLRDRRSALETFRRENTTIGGQEEGTLILQQISQLEAQRSILQVDIDRLPSASPRIPTLQSQVASLNREIEKLRGQIAQNDGDGLPISEVLNETERLKADLEIALQTFINAKQILQGAEAQATLSQTQMITYVPPTLPTVSTAPVRWLEVLTIFGIAFGIWVISRILLASLRTP